MNMKKMISAFLCLALSIGIGLSVLACGVNTSTGKTGSGKKLKFGLITVHGETSTYDKNFIDAANDVCDELGIEILIKQNVPETDECYNVAKELIEQGCNIIFANSFSHEEYLLKAAKEFPSVQFAHATGTRAHTEKLANFHNAFANIHEGRYITGVAAGLKLKEMIDNGVITPSQAKIGYVGAYTYAEVISGYTAFFLGARSIVKETTMEVTFTGTWYGEEEEREAAEELIENGCLIISQHADSMGAPNACREYNIPNITYNLSAQANCPYSYLTGTQIDWRIYFTHYITAVKNGTESFKKEYDWCGTISDGAIKILDINKNVAASGTVDKIIEVQNALQAGTLHVFDTSKFTVNNQTLSTYKADVNYDINYEKDTQVIVSGVFRESEYRSAPYFDLKIDGIKLNNERYEM